MTLAVTQAGASLEELPEIHAEYSEFAVLARAMMEALQEDRLDEAEFMYARLCILDSRAEDVLIFPVIFAIQRGQALQALSNAHVLVRHSLKLHQGIRSTLRSRLDRYRPTDRSNGQGPGRLRSWRYLSMNLPPTSHPTACPYLDTHLEPLA